MKLLILGIRILFCKLYKDDDLGNPLFFLYFCPAIMAS